MRKIVQADSNNVKVFWGDAGIVLAETAIVATNPTKQNIIAYLFNRLVSIFTSNSELHDELDN